MTFLGKEQDQKKTFPGTRCRCSMKEANRTDQDPDRRPSDDGAVTNGTSEDLPFPDKDAISPALQRTLRRKLESGEADEESVDKELFFRLLGKAAEESDPSS